MFNISDGASNIGRHLQFFHSLIEFMNVNDDYIVLLFVGLVITKKVIATASSSPLLN